jgi:choline dehydrogenase-like flavoprotein
MSSDESVVVIGSGPCGAIAAHQLVHNGIPVTMLESGLEDPGGVLVRLAGRTVFRKAVDHGEESTYSSSGDPGAKWYRTLKPGGLSNQWTGAVPRFAPEDFSDGARLDERFRWPLDYEDLEPFYRRAERLLRVASIGRDVPQLPAGVVEHQRRLPRDWAHIGSVAARRGQGLSVLPLADGPDYLVARRSTAFNSYSNIVNPLRSWSRFRLMRGCTALSLEWSGSRRRVSSVTYLDQTTNREARMKASAVVVACGAIGSAKLLFDSACHDFPDGLGNSNGLLGRYLHDHPKEWWRIDLDRPITRLGRAAYLTRRPFRDTQPLMSTSWTIGLAYEGEKLRSLFPGRTRSLGVQVFGSMIPSDRYGVRPHSTLRDSFGRPAMDIDLQFEPYVLDNVRAARSNFVDLLSDAGYGSTLQPVVPQCIPGTAVHFGGTARMHRDPRYGVTDPWSRLFDVPNVVVADASTFTTSSEKNPTLTAMALASRAAHRLGHDLIGA